MGSTALTQFPVSRNWPKLRKKLATKLGHITVKIMPIYRHIDNERRSSIHPAVRRIIPIIRPPPPLQREVSSSCHNVIDQRHPNPSGLSRLPHRRSLWRHLQRGTKHPAARRPWQTSQRQSDRVLIPPPPSNCVGFEINCRSKHSDDSNSSNEIQSSRLYEC